MMMDDHDDEEWMDCEEGDAMCDAMMNFPEWECTDGMDECPPPVGLMQDWYCPGNSQSPTCLEDMINMW